MFYVLRFFTVKRIIGSVLLIFAIYWLLNGPAIVGGNREKPESQVLTQFNNTHPEISDWITRQKDQYGIYETAVAIQSLQADRTLNPEALKRDLEIRTRLVAIYQKDGLGDDALLWSHGTALDVMQGVPEESERYLTELEEAQKNGDFWSLVRNDPIALTSKILRVDEQAREFYRSNQGWFGDMLEVLMSRLETRPDSADTGDAEESAPELIQLDDLLTVASEAKPYLTQIVPEPKKTPIEACIYFETFRQFGEALVMAAEQGVPVAEAAEVVILNRDALVNDIEEAGVKIQDPPKLAARLIQLNRERPSVWAAAQRDGYVLSFDSLVPGLSQSILEKHPDLGVASLIVTQYSEVASQAAKIVDRYGELGVAVLVQYIGSERFFSLLTDPKVDHRIAMLAALESDVGLEAVAENAAYLDKVIDENGDPTKPDWWENVPLVGGIADVARNYAKGYPSHWSEIGWAAWDVADIGLMCVSFGTSKIVTTAAKQTAKSVGKNAATKLTTAGIKRAAPATQQSALKRMITAMAKSKAVAPVRWTGKTIIHVGGTVKTAGSNVVSAVRHVVTTAKNIPPGVRIWVARGMLATSLFIRVPGQLKALGDSLIDYVKDRIGDVARMVPEALKGAMDKLKELMGRGMGAGFQIFLYILVVVLAFLFALIFLLDARRIPAFAFSGSSRRGGSSRHRARR